MEIRVPVFAGRRIFEKKKVCGISGITPMQDGSCIMRIIRMAC